MTIISSKSQTILLNIGIPTFIKRDNLGVLKHLQDKSGKSKFAAIEYKFKSKDIINLTCYYWSKKMSYPTNFRVGVGTKEFHSWINNKAYN